MPTSTSLRHRAADAARLQRGPTADGLELDGLRPLVVWHERVSSEVGVNQFRVAVRCVLSGSAPEGIHAELTDDLRGRWTVRPRGAWQITNVVAAFDYPGLHPRLTLAITATPRSAEPLHGVDDLRMARDLEAALSALSLPPRGGDR